MKIIVEPIKEKDLKPLPEESSLGFGKIFTDRMLTMTYHEDKGWSDAGIGAYKDFSLSPAACVLHYSQEIFEGLKAYASEDGRVLLFRPEQNAKRMNRGAERMCMPAIPEDDIVQGIVELVKLEKRWVPRAPGTSLYIRPAMIATDPALGLHSANQYLFFIILSPVAAYFKEGFKPVSLYVEDIFVRAVIGGVGGVKTGGNYAASILASVKAQEKGYSQVLWLDGRERKYVEEVGAMNIFFVFGRKLVTPALSGSILSGITRDSVLALARKLGYEAEERLISIDEVLEGIKSGALTESFGTGTAAVVSPVGSLFYKDQNYQVGEGGVGAITRELYQKLLDIQYGRATDPFGWVKEIARF